MNKESKKLKAKGEKYKICATDFEGITLIALVITIIILIILAGVTIVTLTEKNKILISAGTAKDNIQRASAIEQAKIDILAWQTEQIQNKQSADLTDTKVKEILTGKDYVKGEPGDTSFISKEGDYIIEYSELYKKIITDVAKVGDKNYKTIDEAIANWEHNTTLTLLSNVMLSDTIQLKSTEHHSLDLSCYMMTAASNKHAIEIVCDLQSKASYALTIKADTNNPGGITASGKSCIYYKKTNSVQDRPIIRIYSGVFNGAYAINSSSSNGGTNTPQVWIEGGVFNGNLNLSKCMLRISEGLFNGRINCTGDSSAYRRISGGTFKSWQFMTAGTSAKFSVGTQQGTFNVGVYVDDNNYLVVGGPVITEAGTKFKAFSTNYAGWSSYLQFSSAKENGLYYTSVSEALADNNKSTDVVTIYTDTVDLTNLNYKGTINLSKNINNLVITFTESAEPLWKVTTSAEGKEITFTDVTSNGIVIRTYNVV